MSNPTELPDLAEAVRKLVNAKGRFHTAQNYAEVVEALAQYDARRAQPEGEAPQAEPVARVNDKYSRGGYNDEIDVLLRVGTKLYAHPPAATLSPLCGAQHADSGASDLDAFGKWKAYPLPDLNSDGNFDKDWLHREFVAFKAGRRAALAAQLDGGQEGSES